VTGTTTAPPEDELELDELELDELELDELELDELLLDDVVGAGSSLPQPYSTPSDITAANPKTNIFLIILTSSFFELHSIQIWFCC
jgi:hypothetical protein